MKKVEDYAFAESSITTLTLGKAVEEIGKYAFYRCFSLHTLVITDRLREIGAGAFTGCSPRQVEIDFYDGEKSCLKTIVEEIRYALYVTLRYHRTDGTFTQARLLFPEHYEEAVENTPARLLETHYHGSGGDYRQCFFNRELNYEEYDSLLPRAIVEEPAEIIAELAAGRLKYPYKLTQKAKDCYLAWLKENLSIAAIHFVRKDNIEMLRFFSAQDYWNQEALFAAVEAASKEKNTEVLSMLLDERYRRFPKRKKVFEL